MKPIRWLAALTAVVALPAPSRATPPDPAPEARALMRDHNYPEAAQHFTADLAGNRFDGRAWADYGYCLHAQKQYEPAIAAARKAIELGFNPGGQMYNIACGRALLGRPDPALDGLRRAFENGFVDQETLESDADLASLRADPRFIRLTGLNSPAESSPAKRWEWDLDFLARRMEQMHWNLYAKVPKEAFRAELTRLKADAPTLSADRTRAAGPHPGAGGRRPHDAGRLRRGRAGHRPRDAAPVPVQRRPVRDGRAGGAPRPGRRQGH